MFIYGVLPSANPRVNRELQHQETIILKRIAKAGRPPTLLLCADRKIKENHKPHVTGVLGFHG
jgi:hypothetical protein